MQNNEIAQKNIRLRSWIYFLSGMTFLIPIITLFYKYTWLSIFDIVIISNVSTLAIWIFELPTSVIADTMWRKRPLVISVICNLISAIFILIFPSFRWFVIASFFSWLYFAFGSWTCEAFLEDNLRIIWKEKDFGKEMWNLMFLGTLASVITPIIAWIILKFFWDSWYTILIILDIIFILWFMFFTLKLKEVVIIQKFNNFRELFVKNIEIAKTAFQNVFYNPNLRLLLIYRSFANHVAFFFIISLPVLVQGGMSERIGGVVVAVAWVTSMFASKFAYKIGERKSYSSVRVFSTIAQAILMILAWFLVQYWIWFAIVFIVFNLFEWFWMPSRNHVLVWQTWWKAIATTRSIIFGIFALYTTLWKQVLSFFDVKYALIIMWIFILMVNIILANKILKLEDKVR